MSWALNIAIALDQLANVLLAGAPDETLSSRAHRMRVKGHRYWGWTANAIDRLFFWQPGHCERAWRSELLRLQQPPSLRVDEH
ncbi:MULTISPECIES: hypothetical protein [Acidovorax]|jgi:hypothetical protein|uniref:Uncharacterized protein n=1 Tax=Acidovorax carolinensis TaxID=553814 RepID=A0A240TPL7_9BURK|nr:MULTISPECIES: hypothetical protein [Acidovorax]ART47569.1 hypothetical protein CBP33_05030 [Acidovorax carolinensis]ART55748.1 hypothetical protein CBP35_13470 [Acidovorax carolinensis]ART58385.1 hypothetical protein CBP36_05465 [Acidovorax carolinensis]MBP3979925.1 hypothetical protein [Acidovorax sp. JG5]